MVVRNSEMLGVRRKGTGRLASKSPVASFMSNRKYATFSFPVSYILEGDIFKLHTGRAEESRQGLSVDSKLPEQSVTSQG